MHHTIPDGRYRHFPFLIVADHKGLIRPVLIVPTRKIST